MLLLLCKHIFGIKTAVKLFVYLIEHSHGRLLFTGWLHLICHLFAAVSLERKKTVHKVVGRSVGFVWSTLQTNVSHIWEDSADRPLLSKADLTLCLFSS